VVGLQLVVFVSNAVTPAVWPQVAGRPGASHKIIHFTPDGRLARRFLGIELHASLGEHEQVESVVAREVREDVGEGGAVEVDDDGGGLGGGV